MVITTKPKNHKGAISNEYYNIRSPLSSTGIEIFVKKWSDSSEHTVQKKQTSDIRMEKEVGRKKLAQLSRKEPSSTSSSK
ncbi:MAG: hypothetical protein IKJ91_10690 [Clostridia bacterium]|nr:hypothetical protein [Clostridia bacterium]